MNPTDEKDPKPEKEDKRKLKLPPLNDKNSNFRTLAIWLLIILAALYTSKILMPGFQEDVRISYSEFRNQLEKDNLEKVEMIDNEVTGYLKTEEVHVNSDGKIQKYKVFKVNLLPISDNTIIGLMIERKVVMIAKEKGFNFWSILIVWLPWLLFIGFWLFFMRQMQGGQKGIFNFGKSRARMLSPDKSKVTFNDVAGADEAKQELQEIIEFLKDPSKFTQLGGKIPKGALLLGPPGTGKTLLARAVAGEAGVPFFSMSGSDFVEMFVGVGASRVRDLFETGKRNAPCIIFIDEIDAVGRQRGAGLGGGHDEREQTLNQLLVEMDGFESNEGVILIAATNRPDVLDSALLRPGRFDRQIVVDLPDVKGREGILKVHTQKIKLAANLDLEIIAKGTPGMSGADLANLVNEAALLAARKNKREVSIVELEEAKDKVMMGAERRSMSISQEEKKIIAYHESGHVLIAKFIPGSDPIHKVTIIPRGRALGVTHSIPVDDRHLYSRTWVNSKICQLLGGRIAEKLVFNEISSGAGNDIEVATRLARMMVCEWGMSDSLGTIAYGNKQDEIFLGREIARHRDFSDSTAMKIDDEVKRIIDECFSKSEKILTDNLNLLHALSTELLKKEILTSEEIDELLAQIKRKKVTSPVEQLKHAGRPVREPVRILEKTESTKSRAPKRSTPAKIRISKSQPSIEDEPVVKSRPKSSKSSSPKGPGGKSLKKK